MNKQQAIQLMLNAFNKQAKTLETLKSTIELAAINTQELNQSFKYLQTLEEPKKDEVKTKTEETKIKTKEA